MNKFLFIHFLANGVQSKDIILNLRSITVKTNFTLQFSIIDKYKSLNSIIIALKYLKYIITNRDLVDITILLLSIQCIHSQLKMTHYAPCCTIHRKWACTDKSSEFIHIKADASLWPGKGKCLQYLKTETG